MTIKKNEEGSFRDPSGRVYYQNGQVLRDINYIYQANYKKLMKGGLYRELTKSGMLVKHVEIKNDNQVYKTIKPDTIPFISYPYEWCFSQLKSAALLTLNIEKLCLKHGMNLKDASAFNIQFIGKKPIFIDTLSFEEYISGKPWVAYRQFCQQFLAPLALMTYTDNRLSKLANLFLDGIPLDLTDTLLPLSAKINFGILGHIVLNSKSQHLKSTKSKGKNNYILTKQGLESIIDSLISLIKNLKPKKRDSTWGEYYSNTNYNQKSFNNKGQLVEDFLKNLPLKTILDLGANNGYFSEIAGKSKAYVISADYDEKSIEDNFLHGTSSSILPLVIDFMNPSASLGWANQERKSFWERANVDLIMMLATIHHLAISNNLPFEKIASLIKDKCRYLIIEFVPKSDSKVKILLSQREDIFDLYTEENFEKVFNKYFKIIKKENILGSQRYLYLMEKK